MFRIHGQGCGCPEDDCEEVRELGNEKDDSRSLTSANQPILAKFGPTLTCLLASKAARPGFEAVERVGDTQPVDRARHRHAFSVMARKRSIAVLLDECVAFPR